MCVKGVCVSVCRDGGSRYAIDLLWSLAARLAVLLLACRPSGHRQPPFLSIVP